MTERAERREEIKLVLEYIKLATSFAVFFVVVFAGLQWRVTNQAAASANLVASLTLYQRMTNEWRDHLKAFVEKPYLRPYFEEKKEFTPDDEHKQQDGRGAVRLLARHQVERHSQGHEGRHDRTDQCDEGRPSWAPRQHQSTAQGEPPAHRMVHAALLGRSGRYRGY